MTYIDELMAAIRHLHGCEPTYAETTPVKEVFRGQTAWEGNVLAFTLTGHPKARRCYAWGVPKATGKGWEITTVLEISPVDSPQVAVRIAIAAEARKRFPGKSNPPGET